MSDTTPAQTSASTYPLPAPGGVARALVPLAAIALLAVGYRLLAPRGDNALVVYCSHDLVHAEPILAEFQRRTGIRLAVSYDTEATKSLGMVERIANERDRPECDVLWANEALGAAELARTGALEAYQGTGWHRIPPAYRDPDGRWAGMGARLRVWLARKSRVEPDVGGAIERRLAERDLSRVAIAKPLYGTTLTHYAALWHHEGADWVKAWHADWRSRGVREVPGNAVVKALVVADAVDLGLTDTDDAFAALSANHLGAHVQELVLAMVTPDRPRESIVADLAKATSLTETQVDQLLASGIDRPSDAQLAEFARILGVPVADLVAKADEADAVWMAPVEIGGRTIAIPNAIAIVRGTKRQGAARRLADYLLSEEVELALANGPARQVPLGPIKHPDALAPEVRALLPMVARSIPLAELTDDRARCLAWLKGPSR